MTETQTAGLPATETRGGNDVRRWQYYPIQMPLTADGQGPAPIGVDATTITYEVWDREQTSYGSFENLPDAINESMRLNALAAHAELDGGYHDLLARLEAVQHASDRPYAASVAGDAAEAIRLIVESRKPRNAASLLEWSENRNRVYPFDGPDVVRIWEGKGIGFPFASVIEFTDGQFTLLCEPTCGRYQSLAEAQAVAQADFDRRIAPLLDRPTVGTQSVSVPDLVERAFEIGFRWRGQLVGQTLEDSRAVGRTLQSYIFDGLEVNTSGMNSFESSDAGIVAAKARIIAALRATADGTAKQDAPDMQDDE